VNGRAHARVGVREENGQKTPVSDKDFTMLGENSHFPAKLFTEKGRENLSRPGFPSSRPKSAPEPNPGDKENTMLTMRNAPALN
jgi:hypothetical protein